MGRELLKSFLFSLEWRVYAFTITTLFLWATTGHFAFALGQALGLQVILLVAHSFWYYLRSEGYIPTFEQLSTKLAGSIFRALMSRR